MLKKKKLPIRWDKEAIKSLKDVYDYIKKDSPITLLKLAKSLNDFPEKYSRELYLSEEPENFRSVAKWSYKLIYEVTEKEIIIIMLFHTSQNPDKIKKGK